MPNAPDPHYEGILDDDMLSAQGRSQGSGAEAYGLIGLVRMFLPLDRRIEDIMETAGKTESEWRRRSLGKNLFRNVKLKMKKEPGWEPDEDMIALMEEAEVDFESWLEQAAEGGEIKVDGKGGKAGKKEGTAKQDRVAQLEARLAQLEKKGTSGGKKEKIGALGSAIAEGVDEAFGGIPWRFPNAEFMEDAFQSIKNALGRSMDDSLITISSCVKNSLYGHGCYIALGPLRDWEDPLAPCLPHPSTPWNRVRLAARSVAMRHQVYAYMHPVGRTIHIQFVSNPTRIVVRNTAQIIWNPLSPAQAHEFEQAYASGEGFGGVRIGGASGEILAVRYGGHRGDSRKTVTKTAPATIPLDQGYVEYNGQVMTAVMTDWGKVVKYQVQTPYGMEMCWVWPGPDGLFPSKATASPSGISYQYGIGGPVSSPTEGVAIITHPGDRVLVYPGHGYIHVEGVGMPRSTHFVHPDAIPGVLTGIPGLVEKVAEFISR
jgi:hypothetical protein